MRALLLILTETGPDYLDLDSDGDGCYDVVEAGYDDPDGDGRPGLEILILFLVLVLLMLMVMITVSLTSTTATTTEYSTSRKLEDLLPL